MVVQILHYFFPFFFFFYVKGKNSAGFSEPSKAFELEIAATEKLTIDNGTVLNIAVEKGKTYKLPTSAQYGYYDTKNW